MPPFIVLLAIAALILFLAMLATRQAAKSRGPLRLHNGRERQDKERDAMLRLAAYVTLRYANLPTQQALRADVEQLLDQKPE